MNRILEKRIKIIPLSIFCLALILAVSSCKKSKFEQEFECTTPMSFSNTKTYSDVLGNFEFEVPKSWKTKLYYDEYQSKLYAADTTRELSESYIIDVTWHQGELVFNEEFEKLVAHQVVNEFELIPVKEGYGDFLDKPAYYNIATGKVNNMSWHYLQIYIQHNVDEYYTLSSKIYGNDLVTERICSSFALFNELVFLK